MSSSFIIVLFAEISVFGDAHRRCQAMRPLGVRLTTVPRHDDRMHSYADLR